MCNNKGIVKNDQVGTIMENIGISYYQMEKFEEATKCYEKALTLKKKSNSKVKLPNQVENTSDIAMCMHMLGNCGIWCGEKMKIPRMSLWWRTC
jgi:tetratricopeptide (TPR) repeat protein